MEKLPVNIISGFLGAGKTTAIIKLLSQKGTDENWAVIINEFGKISIDSQTLRSTLNIGKVFDISGGCICCTAKGYLNENLEEIIQSGKYSRIIIEPSGLGGIDMVSEIVESKPSLILNPVICLVDITGIENKRLQMNPVYKMQISKSDLVFFTKTDLVSNDSDLMNFTIRFISAFPEAKILRKNDLNLSVLNHDLLKKKDLLPSFKFRLIDTKLIATNYLQKSYIFDILTFFNTDTLSRLLRKHASIIRAKGFLQTESGWKLLNYTLTDCTFEPCKIYVQNEIIIITDRTESDFISVFDVEIERTILESEKMNFI